MPDQEHERREREQRATTSCGRLDGMLVELTDPEKGALIDLLVDQIEGSEASPKTDLLHSVLAKLGADAAADPVDPASPLDDHSDRAARFAAGRPAGRPDDGGGAVP